MSTSDPSAETVLTDSKLAENQQAGIGALPDLAMITRLANEFFSALPVHPGPGSLSAAAPVPASSIIGICQNAGYAEP